MKQQKQQKLLSGLLAGFMLMSQVGSVGAGVALADESPSPSPSPSVEPSASPVPSAEPSPSASPSPSSSSSPSPSASPSPSPSASPATGAGATGPGQCTGVIPKWVFDTVSQTWVAADKSSFSCDMASGYWLSPKYYFDKQSGWYQILPPAAHKSSDLLTAPEVVHTTLGDLVVGSQDYQTAQALGLLGTGPDSILVSGTGAGSSNQATISNNGQTWMDLTNLVNVINTLQSTATTGNVAATSNTVAGSLSTGTASVLANIVNLLASAWSWSNGNLNFFMQNFGSQTGDIILSPTQTATGGGGQLGAGVSGTGADSTNTAGVSNANTLNVNAKDSGNIVNNLDLSAQSGNASASSNTVAGNVATGNAMAEVNIINLINSFIASGNSFFGILNVFGNLNGDILFPNGFLNGAIGSNAAPTSATVNGTGAGSTNVAGVTGNSQTTASGTAIGSVANNIQTTAASGAVNASANTESGTAASGDATTTQSAFNLANTSVFGDNAVLVIVNVLGHWVGKIMSLGGGGQTQSALLTGNATVGTTNTGAGSTNTATVANSDAANVNMQSAGSITNNVNVTAKSGDATANKNTSVGDVKTGEAKASSSVANIFNSVLNIKHWFGVLVINVFGDWVGSVGEDTAAGAAVASAQPQASATPQLGVLGLIAAPVKQFSAGGSAAADSGNGTGVSGSGKVAGSSTVLTAAAQEPAAAAQLAAAKGQDLNILFVLSAIVMLVAGAMISIERRMQQSK